MRRRWSNVVSRAALAVTFPTLMFLALGVQAGISAGSDRPVRTPDLLVSENSRYFVDAAGDPFFWMADTAWSMPINLTREEVAEYLDKRVAQGFNVVQIVAVFNQAGGPGPNRYGDWPYGDDLSALAVTDGSDPANEAQYDYWDHLDFIVAEANLRGVRVALLPIWAHGQVGTILTAANAEAYGEFIGARYRDGQIVWVLGGDDVADGVEAVWDNVARGVAEGVSGGENYKTMMMTYHPIGGSSSSRWFRGEPWLTFDMIQGGHCLRYNERRNLLDAAYVTSPTRPFLDGEPIYAGHPYCWDQPPAGYSTPLDVRRDAYWAAFAGAAGHTYGDHAVWQFVRADGRPAELGASGDWRTAMDDDAAWQMRNFVDLMETHPWWKGRPDSRRILTGEVRGGPERLAAMSASDGSYAMVYSPDGEPFEADLAVALRGAARVAWFDPRTGEYVDPGALADGPSTYEPPTGDDWVLVAVASP